MAGKDQSTLPDGEMSQNYALISTTGSAIYCISGIEFKLAL